VSGEAPDRLAIDATEDGIAFWIHVTPRARRPSVGPAHGDALRVAIQAPPVEGRANAACIEALAEALDVPRADVRLEAGAKSRRKRVRVAGAAQALRARLQALAEPG